MHDHASVLHEREFRDYARSDGAPGGAAVEQPPIEEMLAEHHLIELVLQAMEHESGSMKGGAGLRTDFWAAAIEFMTEFVLCHRDKETRFFSALAGAGGLGEQEAAEIHREHQISENLVLHLQERAAEGDWEGVVRVVSAFIFLMRPHMRREEESLSRPAAGAAVDRMRVELRGVFREEEARAWAGRQRRDYVEVAAALVSAAREPPE